MSGDGPYSFIVIGRRLIGPELNLFRGGNPFTSPNSYKLNGFLDASETGSGAMWRPWEEARVPCPAPRTAPRARRPRYQWREPFQAN